MAEEERESTRGFRVQDRRRFSPETGEARSEETEQKPEEESYKKAQSVETDTGSVKHQEAHAQPPEPISFSSFILGLITQALMFMGEVSLPSEQSKHVDLAAAQQMIDLLSVLKQKTKGNLEPSEEAMLDNALFDLRMRYVQTAKK